MKINVSVHNQRRSLKAVLLLPLTAAVAVFVIIYLYSYAHLEAEYAEEDVDNAFVSAQRVFDSAVRANTHKLAAVLTAISGDEALRRAMLASDRPALLQRANSIFASLREGYGITHFYFIHPERAVFLRVHQPDRYGDVIDRFTAKQAEATGKLAAGLELGPAGTFTLRAVVPWRDGDRLIGYIELGEEVGYILDSIRELPGLELFVTIKKRYLSQPEWARGMAMLNRQGNWDFLPDSVVAFQTMNTISSVIQKALVQEDLPVHAHAEISDQEGEFRMAHMPLSDVEGRHVGSMLLLRDVTARSAQTRRTAIVAGGIAFGLGGALLGLFYLVIGRVEKRLASSQAEIRKSEARFRDLVESSSDWIWEVDASVRYVYASPKIKHLLGYEPAEMLGKTPFDFMSPEEAERVAHVFAGIAAEHRSFQALENRNLHKDGRVVVLETSGVPILDHAGNLLGYRGVDRDITERKRADDRLHASEERLRLIADTVPEILYEADVSNFAATYVSHALTTITGFEPAEFVDNPNQWAQQLHEQDRERVFAEIQRALDRGAAGYAVEYRLRHKDGTSLLWFEDRGTIVYDPRGKPLRIVGAMSDITARKRAEKAIEESTQRFFLYVQQTPLAVIEWDMDFRVVEWNPAAERIFGYAKVEAVGRHAMELIVPESAKPHVAQIWENLLTGRGGFRSTNENLTKDGKTIYCEWYNTTLMDANGRAIGVASLAHDVTDQKRAAERVSYLAYYDDLTGLPNRMLFKDRLSQAFIEADRKERLVGLMFLDIDHFKVVNDTLGHEAGNVLLRAVAKRLQGCIRASDTVARFGGDEFAVIFTEIEHVDNVVQLAQRIVHGFHKPFDILGRELFVTLSMGITLYPFDDGDGEILLRNADSAMYAAKAAGRDCFQFYAADMTARATEHLALQTGLRHALDHGEFILHYQPQLEVESGRVIGVEALVRWQDPNRGMISPAQFIPVAEETGLIVPLGDWVLRTACLQAKTWQEQGLPQVRMAVNVSARQFKEPLFSQRVLEILHETGLDPRCLELEVTESILIDSHGLESVGAVLQGFKQAGIMIALDDFGTGYSSLSYLKRFPIDKLKIDQSFVRDALTDTNDAGLVRAIIAMAHALELRTIAEGVETQGQFDFLRAVGCPDVQGYHIARPMPAEQAADFILRCNTV